MSQGELTIEQRQKQVISRLINENAKLRIENRELKKKVAVLEERLETVLLRMAELEEIIFGKKKKKKDNDKDNANLEMAKKVWAQEIYGNLQRLYGQVESATESRFDQ